MRYIIFLSGLIFMSMAQTGCGEKQYGIGTYNYSQMNEEASEKEKHPAHGTSSHFSTRSERKRIRYYNDPKFKQKELEKRRNSKARHPMDRPKSQ